MTSNKNAKAELFLVALDGAVVVFVVVVEVDVPLEVWPAVWPEVSPLDVCPPLEVDVGIVSVVGNVEGSAVAVDGF